jgi:hypothetical protein
MKQADRRKWLLLALVLGNLLDCAVAVLIDDDAPVECIPVQGSKYCVAISADEAVCASDPFNEVRMLVDRPAYVAHYHLGVAQRIDGSEAEQNAIRELIKVINAYWYEEVLSNDDYVDVRHSW